MEEIERGTRIAGMSKFWIFASIAALGVGSLLAWRMWRVREHPELPRFFFTLSFGLAIWMILALCLFTGAIRLGFLVSTFALYLPAMLVVVLNSGRAQP